MASQQLYIIDKDGITSPATWAECDQWEQTLEPSERCPLGKKLKVDVVGSATVMTLFCLSPLGYYGRKPQLFTSFAVGADLWMTSVYTSLRASLSGHRELVSKIKKGGKRLTEKRTVAILPSDK